MCKVIGWLSAVLILWKICHCKVKGADPRCPAPFGLFAHPTDCHRYISCWGGRGFSLSCGRSMVFNPVTTSCIRGKQCPRMSVGAPETGETVRLILSRQQGAGLVEILHENQWAPITSASFSDALASLVCRRLGYSGFSSWFSSMSRSHDTMSVNIRCPTGARNIESCQTSTCDKTCKERDFTVSIRCEIESSSRCPQTSKLWLRWKDNCYLASDLSLPREDARSLCNNFGGNLLSIDGQREHEFISCMLKNLDKNSEFYTDGVGVILAGNGLLWAWQSSRFSIQYHKWWPGWNSTSIVNNALLPDPVPSPACISLKKSFPLTLKRSLGRVSLYDSGFFFFTATDCVKSRPFICKAALNDFGCRNGIGTAYSGSANVSATGLPCLAWSDPTINNLMGRTAHARASSQKPFDLSLIGNHNFCRNPNASPRPWCFVNPEVTGECDVPFCSSQVEERNSFSTTGRRVAEDSALIEPPSSEQPISTAHLSSNSPSSRRHFFKNDFTRQAARNKDPESVTFSNFTPHPDSKPTLLRPLKAEKIRCKFKEYHCEDSNLCIRDREVCDGTRQCFRGDDERSCKRFLSRVEIYPKSTLIIRDVLQMILRKDIGICVKACIDSHMCKTILYDSKKRECSLSRLSIGESGIIPSTRETLYVVRSKRTSCSNKLKCDNGRCIASNLACNGNNDCGDNTDEAKCTRPNTQNIKLIGGMRSHEGNVQIQMEGEWGYICDDGFGWKEADVICNSLGFSGAAKFTRNNAFGRNSKEHLRSSPRFWLSEVNCFGSESNLSECRHKGIGHHDCGPTEISGIVCRTGTESCASNQFECKERNICIPRTHVCNNVVNCPDASDETPELCEDFGVTRLLSTKGSPGNAVGTVHVKHNSVWGTVCDDYFDYNHAKVVCRSLGYGPVWAIPYTKAHFGRGSGNVFIDEPGCKGHETHLSACQKHSWGPGNCDHAEDVGVFCSDQAEIRLVGGKSENEGRIEILLGGVWGTICSDDFDDYDAKVICKMNGYSGGGISHRNAAFGRGSGPVWLDNVDCTGVETDISDCKKSKPGTSACSHSEDAGVTCYSTDPGAAIDRSLSKRLPASCGFQSSFSSFLFDNLAKIVGGRTVKRLDSPWLVSLQLREKGIQKHNCGGVVLSEDLVLTAAHCFRTHSRHSYVVRVGEFDLQATETSQEDFLIDKLYVHHDFDTTVEFNNDVALIKIVKRNGRGIKLGGSIQPVCLPPSNADYSKARQCKITGWGTTNEQAAPIPQRLPRAGEVKIFPMSSCLGKTGYSAHEVTSGMFCAGKLDGSVDTCTGDSGGPLTCEINGQHYLYGITSWGKGCGRKGQPGMYTKITKYIRWLNGIMP